MASYIVYFTYTDNNDRQAEINSGPYTFEEAKQMRREYEQFAADGTKGTAQIKKIGTDTTSWYHMESKFIKASDDWYPNYPDGTIKLKILAGYNKYSSYVRMVAAGMDDFMMEKDITITVNENTKETVKRMFKTFKEGIFDVAPEIVNHEWFYERGFTVG